MFVVPLKFENFWGIPLVGELMVCWSLENLGHLQYARGFLFGDLPKLN